MANSLTIRLCQKDPDSARNIALNPWCEAFMSLLHGTHSIAGIKGFYNHRMRSILTFMEQRDIANYQTPDDIETWLLAIDTGP